MRWCSVAANRGLKLLWALILVTLNCGPGFNEMDSEATDSTEQASKEIAKKLTVSLATILYWNSG